MRSAVRDENVDSKFGHAFQYDPEFKGPIKNRSCTDIICLFLFIAFIAGWAVVAYLAYSQGNPEILVHPTDSRGRMCGMGELTSKPFLFFFDITKCNINHGCRDTPQVCVEKCPDKTFVAVQMLGRLSQQNVKDMLICKDNTDKTKTVEELIETNACARYYLKSKPVVGRCLPAVEMHGANSGNDNITDENGKPTNLTFRDLADAGDKLAKIMNLQEVGEKIFQDFQKAWWLMLLFLLFAMVISFIWILLMRIVAGFMVFLSIILAVAVLGAASAFCFWNYYYLDKGQPPAKIPFMEEFTQKLTSFSDSKKTWLAVGIIFGIIWLILILILIFLRKRILLAVALIREGSRAVGTMMSSLFFPLVPYLLQLAVFAFWGSVAIYLASAKKAVYQTDDKNATGCNPNVTNALPEGVQCLFSKYSGDDNFLAAQIFNLFGLFWALFFVVGIGQVSLAGAFASYYWAFRKPEDIPYFAVAGGMWRCFRYHLGSVAFGSLLIAIVRMIRVMLEYIDQQCKKYENAFTKALICICKCCFWCLEKFMKFLSKNAYIMMAVYGKNFCTSAKDSFSLLMRNVVRVVVLDKVTDYLLLLGKLVIVGVTAFLSFFFFSGRIKYLENYTPGLNYYFLPVFTVTIGAYLIATGFFNVYNMAVDTLFLCFLEDCERNDGSPEKPYYMSKELMKILDKKNKLVDKK